MKNPLVKRGFWGGFGKLHVKTELLNNGLRPNS
jgi:hypothetical protein